MKIRFPIGYKFISGFIVVIAVAAFVPKFVPDMEVAEWTKEPLSLLITILIGLTIGHFFTRTFTKNIGILTSLAQKISRGDLSHTSTTGTASRIVQDETSDLGEALLKMVANLKGLIRHIQDAVTNLTDSQGTFNSLIAKGHETSRVVMEDTSKIFSGALEQASHVESTSKTVKELAQIADEVATKVTETSNASQKVDSMVHRGANTATSAIEKMETIFKGIEKTESAARRLEEKINDIPKILDVITHISRQTDLLALNATIEASKAGEHGRGFALVAEEVRRFADNTNRSVEDVDRIVKDLKAEVEGVVQSASESSSFITEGRDDIRKVRDILGDITQYASEVSEKSTLILALTQKQKEMAENSVDTIEEVAKIAHDNLTATEGVEKAVETHGTAIDETFKASQNLSELSEELKEIVSTFKISETED